MRERGGGVEERERKKLYCNGWIHVNELKKGKNKNILTNKRKRQNKKKGKKKALL